MARSVLASSPVSMTRDNACKIPIAAASAVRNLSSDYNKICDEDYSNSSVKSSQDLFKKIKLDTVSSTLCTVSEKICSSKDKKLKVGDELLLLSDDKENINPCNKYEYFIPFLSETLKDAIHITNKNYDEKDFSNGVKNSCNSSVSQVSFELF